MIYLIDIINFETLSDDNQNQLKKLKKNYGMSNRNESHEKYSIGYKNEIFLCIGNFILEGNSSRKNIILETLSKTIVKILNQDNTITEINLFHYTNENNINASRDSTYTTQSNLPSSIMLKKTIFWLLANITKSSINDHNFKTV